MKLLSQFSEVRAHQPWPVTARDVIRRTALDMFGLFDSEAHLDRPRVHLLYLHHVLADEEQPFRALLKWLSERHTFISYSDAVRRLRGELPIDRPYIAFSFDDGLRNALRAAELLAEAGASACYFVCSSMAVPRSDEDVREFCANELHLPPAEFLSFDDMETLLRGGHEIGNHSSAHRTLATLSGAQLEDDVAGSLAELRRHLGNGIEHFAWPRGLFHHFSAPAAAAVFRAGHTSCASAERGAHIAPTAAPHELCIRRDQVIAAWPLRHTRHFLVKASKSASAANNMWPDGWLPQIEGALR
ncbi:MAG TPA: polysaccharide deacetylase family protein [Thermoanaerobaculia bacterium]|nr:polysaccharide deacetylase family protein [Thermoanaerobaculia bacterium]